jgi:hypothetical protein
LVESHVKFSRRHPAEHGIEFDVIVAAPHPHEHGNSGRFSFAGFGEREIENSRKMRSGNSNLGPNLSLRMVRTKLRQTKMKVVGRA